MSGQWIPNLQLPPITPIDVGGSLLRGQQYRQNALAILAQQRQIEEQQQTQNALAMYAGGIGADDPTKRRNSLQALAGSAPGLALQLAPMLTDERDRAEMAAIMASAQPGAAPVARPGMPAGGAMAVPGTPDPTTNRIVTAESGGRPDAQNPNSSASGMFQITNGMWNTWAPQLRLTDAQRNDPAAQRQIFDAERGLLSRRLGREPSPGELYANWGLGRGAFEAFRRADPNANAYEVYRSVAPSLADRAFRTNPGLLERNMTVAQVLDRYGQRAGGGPAQGAPQRPAAPSLVAPMQATAETQAAARDALSPTAARLVTSGVVPPATGTGAAGGSGGAGGEPAPGSNTTPQQANVAVDRLAQVGTPVAIQQAARIATTAGQDTTSVAGLPGSVVNAITRAALSGNRRAIQQLQILQPMMQRETQIERVRLPDGSEMLVPRQQAAGMVSAAPPRDAQFVDLGADGPQGEGRYLVENGRPTQRVGAIPRRDQNTQYVDLGEGAPEGPGRYEVLPGGGLRRTASIPQQSQTFDQASTLRRELHGLPAYTEYAQVAPRIEAIRQAVPVGTRAADLDLVFAFANLLDPGSVVREGEALTVQRTGSLPDQLLGSISRLTGGAALQPDTREALLRQAESRFATIEGPYRAAVERQRDLARRLNLDPDLVASELGPQRNRYGGRTSPGAPGGGAVVVPGPGGAGTASPPEAAPLAPQPLPAGRPQGRNAPPRVNSDAEAERLPPGTPFIGPDGRNYVR